MDERAASNRRGKQKGNLRFGKDQGHSLVRENPGTHDQKQKNDGANAADDGVQAAEHVFARPATGEKKLKEVAVEIDEAEQSADEILRLLEALQTRFRAIDERARQKKKK